MHSTNNNDDEATNTNESCDYCSMQVSLALRLSNLTGTIRSKFLIIARELSISQQIKREPTSFVIPELLTRADSNLCT